MHIASLQGDHYREELSQYLIVTNYIWGRTLYVKITNSFYTRIE
jgi:hypothetical protein